MLRYIIILLKEVKGKLKKLYCKQNIISKFLNYFFNLMQFSDFFGITSIGIISIFI